MSAGTTQEDVSPYGMAYFELVGLDGSGMLEKSRYSVSYIRL